MKAPVAPALRVPGSSPVLAVVTAYVQAHKVLDVHIAALLDSRGAAATRGVSLTVLDAASLLGLRQRVRPGRARAGALPAGGSGKSGGLWGRSG